MLADRQEMTGANAYSGGTNLEAGTLDLTVQDAAGIGEMNFGGGLATLRVELAGLDINDKFDNTIGAFQCFDHTRDICARRMRMNARHDTVELGSQ